MLDATPLLRLRARFRLAELARQDSVAAQRRVLAGLLHRARDTGFGRQYDFRGIGDVSAYQARVPLRRYEAFWEEWWQPAFPHLRGATWPGRIPYLALSSGTSGGPTKYIPVSTATLQANQAAALDSLVFHVAARPGSRLLAGRNLLLGGSTKLEQLAPDVQAGDLSGIAAARMPPWARRRSYPPRDVALLGDWERKIDAIAHLCLDQPITSISGTPSWLLLFFERMAALKPGAGHRLATIFPQLELIVHGGLGMQPYRDRFDLWLEGSHAGTREVYAASEGFIAAADGGPDDGMRLLADRGLFYEFVPMDQFTDPAPERHWLATAQTGIDYALVVTSPSGLWSYVLGDTVAFTSLHPPRLRVTGRTGWSLSVVGEHVSGGELDRAIALAARDQNVLVHDYAAAPLHPDAADSRGGHLFLVEFDTPPPLDRFAAALDRALAEGNADYASHRAGEYGMRPPRVLAVPPGGFQSWMAARGKLGGQHKVPRVISDPAMLAGLMDAAGLA
jgi:hypothetical protein